jgi:hypothetical protein
MEKLKTNELSLGLDQKLRNDLVDNFEKIQKGVDSQSDSLNKQILDMLGNVAPQDQNEVTQARIDANGKLYDTLKGREDATQLTAETSLEEERKTSSEVQSARTNSQSITYDNLKQRLDNQENDLNNNINSKLAQISVVPETFTNLAALNSKYPTGKTGLFVTADTGHKYIWDNGSWNDAGVYQSFAMADNSVTKDKVDKIGYSQLVNSFAVPSLAFKWSLSIVSVSGDDVFFSCDPAYPHATDFGVTIPVKLEKTPSPTDNFYLNFDYISSALANDAHLDKMEVWITKIDGTMLAKISPTYFYASLTKTSYQLPISATTILNNGLTTSFGIMIATHNISSKTTLSNFRFNDDNGSKTIDLNNQNNKAIVKMARKSPIFGQDYSLAVDNDIISVKSENINPVIEIPYFGLDLSKDIYLSMDVVSDANTTSFAHFWVGKLADTTPNGDIGKGFGHVEFFIDSNTAIQKGVTKDGVIVVTSGDNSKDGLIITNVSISNKPISGDLDNAMKLIDKNTINRHETVVGQPINSISTAKETTISGIDYITPIQNYSGSNGILKKINVYVTNAGKYSFKVARIDQNNLIVNSTADFTLSLVSGYNYLDIEKMNISVPFGAQLFMNVSSANIYSPDSSHLNAIRSLVRDDSHPTTNIGYSGQMLYDAGVLSPFNYCVIDAPINSELKELKSDINKHNTEISQLELFKSNVTIKSPNGVGFRLVVDNNGNLSTTSLVPRKVAVFGNSLTRYSDIGGFGLAASNQNSDWFAYVKNYILNANSSATVFRGSIGSWETDTNSEDRQNYYDVVIKPNLYEDTDLVIIQAIDNINTAERAANIYADTKQLILNIKTASPKARVFWVGSWFVNHFPGVDLVGSVKQACADTGSTFIDITGYSSSPENNSYIGAKITKPDGTVITVTDPGYAAHPGDKGHKIIADTVNSYMGF